MKTSSLFNQISLVSVFSIAVLSILLIVPATDNFIDHTKFYTLLFGALLVASLFVIKTFKQRAVRVSLSPVTGSLILFTLATIASTFFTSEYPVEGLLGLGGIFISTSLIAVLGGSILPKNLTEKFLHVLVGSSTALVVISVLQMIGFGPAQLINRIMGVSLPTTLAFNLTGSPFIALQVVGLTLLTVITYIVSTKKLNKFYAITIPVLVIGTGIFAWSVLPGKATTPNLPSYVLSWSIMLDTIRAPKAALIGAGVSSYRNVYQIFKPLWVNGTNNWAVSYTQAANLPLTLITTMGFLGLISWVMIVFKSLKFHNGSLSNSKPIGVFILGSFALNLIFPFNTTMLVLQAISLACLVANEKHRLPLLQMQAFKFKMLNKPEVIGSKQPINIPFYIGTGIAIALIITSGYLGARSLKAFMLMSQSSMAVEKNNAVLAYELQQEAVVLNPYYDSFRRRYSATSALIGVSLSNKADITEQEKQQVSSLLQQSVTQARAATTLDSSESQNWANLAKVYSNLIGVSDDAVNWTVQSYVTAIESNQNDPFLRLELAEIFVEQESYQEALNIYDQAITLKADIPISHFKRAELLSIVKTPESLREARLSYQRALVLLPSDSEDYISVSTRIIKIEEYMNENNISLEAPEEGEQQQGQALNQNGDQAQDNKLSAPSITEQNLNNTNVVNTESEQVVIDKKDTTSETQEDPTDAMKAMEQ